jgi:hypothetical protein
MIRAIARPSENIRLKNKFVEKIQKSYISNEEKKHLDKILRSRNDFADINNGRKFNKFEIIKIHFASIST